VCTLDSKAITTSGEVRKPGGDGRARRVANGSLGETSDAGYRGLVEVKRSAPVVAVILAAVGASASAAFGEQAARHHISPVLIPGLAVIITSAIGALANVRAEYLKTIAGWAALALVIWWVMEEPASAAHVTANIGTFLGSAAAGITAFFASI
jgi:hypothetical protein